MLWKWKQKLPSFPFHCYTNPAYWSIGVARGLGGAEFTGIAKDRENVAQNRVGEFRVSARRRSKMPRIAHPMMHIFEDIEEMAFRHPLLE